MKHIIVFLFSYYFFISLAYANYLSIGESGNIIPSRNYSVGGSLQSSSAGSGGLNVGALIDAGWTEDLSSRFSLGFGNVDFYVGAGLKYIPFPDYLNQPAIGVKTSIWLARVKDTSVTTFQVAPLLSKNVPSPHGKFTPYVAIPINFSFFKNDSSTGTQFVVGTEFDNQNSYQMTFTGELNLNLKNSESGFILFAIIPFDPNRGLIRRNSK